MRVLLVALLLFVAACGSSDPDVGGLPEDLADLVAEVAPEFDPGSAEALDDGWWLIGSEDLRVGYCPVSGAPSIEGTTVLCLDR